MQEPLQNIPATAGIGLRAQHYIELLDTLPDAGWLEVHPENYFGNGGAPLHYLTMLREHYPISMHGVGLSLGSVDPLSNSHLLKLRSLIERFEPGLVSEHLSWGSVGGQHYNDLFPLPYTEEALEHFCQRVIQTQDFLQRQILVENPSSYLTYEHSCIPENEFFISIAERTGCGLLLDINNIYVSAENHGFDASMYLQSVPKESVGEIHLAGHARNQIGERELLIDDHASKVCDAVWELFKSYVVESPEVPVLIEWDSEIPELNVLLEEAYKARTIIQNRAVAC